MPSDVQVFVRFRDQCVFAGEELYCTITFKNVAEHVEPQTPGVRHAKRNSVQQLAVAQVNARQDVNITARSPSIGRNDTLKSPHKTSASLSSPPHSAVTSPVIGQGGFSNQHKRSVSIISGTSPILPQIQEKNARPGARPAHRRSSTIATPGKYTGMPKLELTDAVLPERQLSADFRQGRAGRRSPLSASHSPSDAERNPATFTFPNERNGQPERVVAPPPSAMPRVSHRRDPSVASRATDQSFDGYAQSNHSGETLVSEQVSMISERPARPRMPSEMIRKHYKMNPPPRKPQAVTLLMGYAQVGATFTLDASLVDQSSFEEVKKKGFLGGQSGGGVVGVKKKARPSSGLFGGFNFASIGESLESIMGGESSGVKEMKAVTNSRAIPLLSTPQSLLFVDAHLEPGDERSFNFSFKLPRGLPASYRGKAIKIVYNLTIGVQGAPGAQQQVSDMRQINVPFKVYPGVSPDGEILGHDLMQPHVILKDLAKTSQVTAVETVQPTGPTAEDIEDSNAKFLTFVDTLLHRHRRRQSSSSLMMDFNPATTTSQSTAIKAIHHAILVSNQVGTSADTSPNRFEIASQGARIAVVTLDRILHRVGEVITVVVDFSESDVVCSSLRATLETCEKVAPSLAVRSATTIARITKKIYASKAENVLYMRRAVFTPTIPVLSTPSFITTGVSLDWFVKLEFGTVRNFEQHIDNGPEVPASTVIVQSHLLEEIVSDERGVIEVAVESLDCDNFEVNIPLTIYGDVTHKSPENDSIVGLSI